MELDECPFCKSKEVFVTYIPNFSQAVQCRKCGSTGPRFELPDYSTKRNKKSRIKGKAMLAWNNRTKTVDIY